jgi:GAF domain-containing protein
MGSADQNAARRAAELPAHFTALLARVEKGAREAESPRGALERAVEALHGAFGRYSWVGIYLVRGEELELGPWHGPAATEHSRIPIGAGVCGAAARSGRTENVPDVRRDARYLACFPHTRSEIVVPIMQDGRVYGEIDIDSDVPAAFDTHDEQFLEAVAAALLPAAQQLVGPGREVTG